MPPWAKAGRVKLIRAYTVGPDDTIELRRKREQIITLMTTISEAIRSTTTSRVCDQLATKISAELGVKVPGFFGKLGSEILSKSEYEITKTTEDVWPQCYCLLTAYLYWASPSAEVAFDLIGRRTYDEDARIARYGSASSSRDERGCPDRGATQAASL